MLSVVFFNILSELRLNVIILSAVMLSVVYAECHPYAECRYS